MTLERPDRVALVGATSEVGAEVKDLLALAGYPSDAVELLDLDEAVGVLTDYGEEARVVVEAAAKALDDHRLACFCGASDTARELAPWVVEGGGVSIDCTAAWLFDDEARLLDPVTDEVRAAEEPEILAIPSAGALLVASLQDLLGDASEDAVIQLLLPASEAHEEGPKQLAQEATALLNFGERSGQEGFGRRLAFDIWPEHASAGVRSSSAGVVDQLRRMERRVPHLSTFRASTFHGVAASVYLPGTEIAAVEEAVERGGLAIGEEGDDGRIDSPARVVGLRGLHVGDAWADPEGGTWAWVMLDNHAAIAAAAVTAIAAHLQVPEADTVN